MRKLDNLLSPKSVSIIGASQSPEKIGAIVLRNILDSKFTGHVYPVNPHDEEINGLQCFPTIIDLPEVVDLAIIAIPAKFVNETLKQIGEKGIKNVVVLSAGFKEIGEEGALLEKEMIAIANQYDLNMLGPNCLGFVNNVCPINATFSKAPTKAGTLRFMAQSGALASSLFDYFDAAGINFSDFVTLGNKAVLNENDILEYFLQQTKEEQLAPIGLYLESISDGKKFLEIATNISKKTPLFIIKPGKTSAAKKAMQSHTGSIAGEEAVLDTALRQAGIIRCQTLEDFFDLSRAFSFGKVPEGPRVAIISNAGGPGVISADAVVTEGLEFADIDDATKSELSKALPRCASMMNPIDVLGDALSDRFGHAVEVILQKKDVDAIMVILTPQLMTQIKETAEVIGSLQKKYNKTVFCSFIGGTKVAEGEAVLNENQVPSFRFPERAIATIAMMWRWKQWQQKQILEKTPQSFVISPHTDVIRNIIAQAQEQRLPALNNQDANALLEAVGIPTPAAGTPKTLDEAKEFAHKCGWPVVLKLSAPGLLHKADLGGVVINIASDDQLETAWNNLQKNVDKLEPAVKAGVSFQMQQQVVNGVEVIVGIKRDPTFGPVLLFGTGGNLAEFVIDRNLKLLPIDETSAKELVMLSKAYTLLKGYRGKPALAVDKLCEAIVRLSTLAELVPEATEIEINPVIVTVDAVWAVDGKVVLS